MGLCRVMAKVGPVANKLEEGICRAAKTCVSRGILATERKTEQRRRERQRAKAIQPKRDGRLGTEIERSPSPFGLPDTLPMSWLASLSF